MLVLTCGDKALQVVQRVPRGFGFEAWRQLHEEFEPRPHSTMLAKSNFGQSIIGQSIGQSIWIWVCVMAPKGGAQTQKNWARRVGQRRVGARRVGAQNFALFFPSPAPIFALFCLSLGSILVVFWWCLEAPGPSNVHVWRAETCSLEGPGLHKHHQNSTRRHTVRDKKNEMVAGEGKRAKFWGVRRRGVRRKGSGAGWSKPTTTTTTTNHTNHNNNTRTAKQTTTHNQTQQHNKQEENTQHRTTLPPSPTPTTTQHNTRK